METLSSSAESENVAPNDNEAIASLFNFLYNEKRTNYSKLDLAKKYIIYENNE